MSFTVGNLVLMIRKISLILFSASIAFLISCKKDKEKIPTIPTASIDLGEIGSIIQVLETIDFSLEASFPAGLKNAACNIWLNDQQIETVLEKEQDSLLFTFSEAYSFEVIPQYSGGNLTFTFTVTDMLDRISGDTIALSIEESSILLIEGKTIAGFNNASVGSFLDIQNDTIYFGSNVQNSTTLKKNISLVFFYTTADKRVLAAPSNNYAESSWEDQSNALWPLFGVENETLLYDLGSNVDYESIITGAQITNVLSSQSTPADSIINLAAGQYIGFQLASSQGGDLGIIQITDSSGKTASEATLTFDAKVQQ